MVFSLSVQAFAENDVLYCRICGRKIPTDSLVCPYCGEKVVHVDDDTAPEQDGSAPAAAPFASPAPSAAPAPVASPVASPAASPAAVTDVKTALSQSSAPSPTTQSTAAVSGPFNTTTGSSTSSNRVRVTKSPTSESVPYGGSCCFIAHAANATSITWYIANSDASIICAASDAPSSVSGLYVSGANSDTLYLSGIPSWWNGAQVQACFTGEGGPVYTETARIWTYQPAVQPCRSNWGFWDWFNYYYWDDPYEYDFPWWYWIDVWDDEPNPPDVKHSITLPGGASVAPEMSDKDAAKVPEATVIHTGHDGPSGSWEVDPDSSNPPPPPPPAPGPSGGSSSDGPKPAPAGFNPGSTVSSAKSVSTKSDS